MKTFVLFIVYFFLFFAPNLFISKKYKPVLMKNEFPDTSKITNEEPVLISDKFSFTEGPACDTNGNVFFTDQPNNQIWEYNTDGKLSLFMENCGRSNGMFFDAKGNLISCADEHNELWSIASDKQVTILCRNYNDEIFNGPNDVWINKKSGGIYFTDPYYERNYWNKDHPHIQAQNVYYLPKGAPVAILADDCLQKPNGIIGTPDGKYLYIADIGGDKTYKYEIGENGHLKNKKLFINKGSDGMTLDTKGNLYITGKGVTIYNKDGVEIQHIPINENWTGNVCFSGKDLKTLFITASKSVYTLQTNVKGIK